MTATRHSTTEFAVLGLLAEGATHGFALSKHLDTEAEIGRVFTVRRPLVYRALDRLVETGLAEAVTTERGDAGPHRVIHRITPAGRRRLRHWLATPVDHLRDLRIEFLLKLTLVERSGRSSLELVRAQRAALTDTIAALEALDLDDPIELWRHHNAVAAGSFLEELERRHTGTIRMDEHDGGRP